MARGKKLSRAEVVRALDLVRSGRTVRTAAATLDCAPATLHRIFAREFPDEYAQALQDRSASKADQADDDMERWKDEEDCAPTIRLAYVKRWNPAYRERQQLEVSGPDGGALEVTVDYDYGRLLTKLEQVGLIRRGPAAALDAAPVDRTEGRGLLPPRTD